VRRTRKEALGIAFRERRATGQIMGDVDTGFGGASGAGAVEAHPTAQGDRHRLSALPDPKVPHARIGIAGIAPAERPTLDTFECAVFAQDATSRWRQ
jgi:hypothetical protein